jgi:apolipoprotein N-acyltransferase
VLSALRPGRREGLAALSGVLLFLSFPKFGHGLVAWVALTPLLVALAEAPSPAHGFRLGYLTGAIASLGIVYWTSIVVVQFGGLAEPIGVAVMVLLCLALALFPSVFGWAMARWIRAHGPSAVLLAPVAWVATEILRAHTLFDFSWCLLGYSQHANLPMIQVARYAAVYGVSFVVAAVSAAIALCVVERRRGPRTTALLATAGLVALVWMHGEWRLGQSVPDAGRVRVGLVQASIAQDEKWDAAHAWANVDRHLELTRRAAAEGARLVVWPESALPFLFDRVPVVAAQLRDLVQRHQIFLLFGNDDREEGAEDSDERGRIWVGAKMLDPAGRLALRYHKIRLVPFGEYVPIQSVLTLGGRFSARLVQQAGDFTPGDEYALGAVDSHPLAAFICYEAIFPDLVREFAARGAQLLVNITNDGWYGRTSAPYQHFAMAKFRAVENERYLVRAANTGISAVVDPRGRVVARTELFERTALVADVPLLTGSTFYTRHGDVFAWGCLGAAVALLAAGAANRRGAGPRSRTA